MKQHRKNTSRGSALIEYVLAVSLLGLTMVLVMKGFLYKTEQVSYRFQTEVGAGEINCNPMENPNCP